MPKAHLRALLQEMLSVTPLRRFFAEKKLLKVDGGWSYTVSESMKKIASINLYSYHKETLTPIKNLFTKHLYNPARKTSLGPAQQN